MDSNETESRKLKVKILKHCKNYFSNFKKNLTENSLTNKTIKYVIPKNCLISKSKSGRYVPELKNIVTNGLSEKIPELKKLLKDFDNRSKLKSKVSSSKKKLKSSIKNSEEIKAKSETSIKRISSKKKSKSSIKNSEEIKAKSETSVKRIVYKDELKNKGKKELSFSFPNNYKFYLISILFGKNEAKTLDKIDQKLTDEIKRNETTTSIVNDSKVEVKEIKNLGSRTIVQFNTNVSSNYIYQFIVIEEKQSIEKGEAIIYEPFSLISQRRFIKEHEFLFRELRKYLNRENNHFLYYCKILYDEDEKKNNFKDKITIELNSYCSKIKLENNEKSCEGSSSSNIPSNSSTLENSENNNVKSLKQKVSIAVNSSSIASKLSSTEESSGRFSLNNPVTSKSESKNDNDSLSNLGLSKTSETASSTTNSPSIVSKSASTWNWTSTSISTSNSTSAENFSECTPMDCDSDILVSSCNPDTQIPMGCNQQSSKTTNFSSVTSSSEKNSNSELINDCNDLTEFNLSENFSENTPMDCDQSSKTTNFSSVTSSIEKNSNSELINDCYDLTKFNFSISSCNFTGDCEFYISSESSLYQGSFDMIENPNISVSSCNSDTQIPMNCDPINNNKENDYINSSKSEAICSVEEIEEMSKYFNFEKLYNE